MTRNFEVYELIRTASGSRDDLIIVHTDSCGHSDSMCILSGDTSDGNFAEFTRIIDSFLTKSASNFCYTIWQAIWDERNLPSDDRRAICRYPDADLYDSFKLVRGIKETHISPREAEERFGHMSRTNIYEELVADDDDEGDIQSEAQETVTELANIINTIETASIENPAFVFQITKARGDEMIKALEAAIGLITDAYMKGGD